MITLSDIDTAVRAHQELLEERDALMLKFARYYASVKHAGQTYSGDLPYTHHLAAVEAVLRRFGGPGVDDGEMLAAAWLHDVVEDTGTKLKQIEELFGAEVARLVGAVTNEPGENRKVRHALTYPKIREAGPKAVVLKLADRIANVEAGGSMVKMYRKEYESFKRNLYTIGQSSAMWLHLDLILLRPESCDCTDWRISHGKNHWEQCSSILEGK